MIASRAYFQHLELGWSWSASISSGRQQHQIHNVSTCLPAHNQNILFYSSWNHVILGLDPIDSWHVVRCNVCCDLKLCAFWWVDDHIGQECLCVLQVRPRTSRRWMNPICVGVFYNSLIFFPMQTHMEF